MADLSPVDRGHVDPVTPCLRSKPFLNSGRAISSVWRPTVSHSGCVSSRRATRIYRMLFGNAYASSATPIDPGVESMGRAASPSPAPMFSSATPMQSGGEVRLTVNQTPALEVLRRYHQTFLVGTEPRASGGHWRCRTDALLSLPLPVHEFITDKQRRKHGACI